jgi:hypothetical protein
MTEDGMTNERKIWEAAIILVRKHGTDAVEIADREVSRHEKLHDNLTSAVWCWISRATAELLKPEPGDGERFQ